MIRAHRRCLLVLALFVSGALAVHDADASTPPAFLSPINYATGGLDNIFPNTGGPVWISVADVNGDGHVDVLVANWCQDVGVCAKSNVGVLLNRSDGTLQAVQTYDTGLFAPAFIATADLNGDHHVDLALTENVGGGGELAVLLNRGDGAFQTATVYDSGGLYATPLVVTDTNGDGKPDLLVSHSQFCTGKPANASCIGVLLGAGNGTFQPAVTYESGGTGAWSLTAADFNGDGHIDVAVAHQCGLATCTGPTAIVGVLAGNGDGSFQPPVTYETHGQSVLAVAADVNGDRRPDLLIGNAPPVPSGD